MTLFIQTLIDGIAVGSLYALIALGYTLVYGILKFINFAHSDIFALGAWLSLTVAALFGITGASTQPPPWYIGSCVLIGSMILCSIVGLLIERFAYKPLRQAPRLNVLITAIGVSLLLENAGILQFLHHGKPLLVPFGPQPRAMPAMLSDKVLATFAGDVHLRLVDVVVFCTALVLVIALQWLIFKTKLGMAMRAVSFNVSTASLMGINSDVIISITFVIGSALAAAAGFLYALKYPQLKQTADTVWVLLGLKAFVAAVVGGIGNVRGAALGGIVIGLVEFFGVAYLSSNYRDVYVFLVLILVLLLRPEGLLGRATVEKVQRFMADILLDNSAASKPAAPDPKAALAELRPPAWTAIPRASWTLMIGVAIAALLFFVVQPWAQGSLIFFAAINIILAVSLTAVNGFTGQFSIGHAGFMALGGYVAATILYYASFRFYGAPDFHGGILSYTGVKQFDGPFFGSGDFLFLFACLAAGLFAAGVGWLVGLPSLRLRGDYLAIVTLGFGEIVRVLLQGTPDQFFSSDVDLIAKTPFLKFSYEAKDSLALHMGGSLGFISIPTYGTEFWAWTAAAITLIATIRLKTSSYGRALLSVREDAIAAQAMGVDITRYKVRAFMFSAFFAGIAGALYAMQSGIINAGEFGFQKSFDIVIMVVLGGLGSVSGATLAAIILTILPQLLLSNPPPSLWPWGIVIAGVIAVLIFFFAPKRKGPLIVLGITCALWEGMRYLAIALHINLAEYRMVIFALLLIIMMILRPQGLFGVREIWDYFPQFRVRKRPGGARRWGGMYECAGILAPLLDVREISISFGGLSAVSGFSCAIPPRALHGLIGPNGAGKTTVFNLLTGVYRPTQGSVWVDGLRIDGMKPHKIAHAGLARTFQNIRLFGELSVLDNLRIGCQARFHHGIPSTILRTGRYIATERAIDQSAQRLLELFGLSEKRAIAANSLPYGDQRRLEIARALATGPKLLLLDEPAAGMNPHEKNELMKLIQFIRDQFEIAILLIEHDMKLVMSICEQITVLDHGETIAVGTPAQVQCNPDVIEAYLGEPV